MKDFRNLTVWRRAHILTLDVYRVTARFPVHECFGLTAQLRRACASVGANIAEGCGRAGGGDFARFLQVAMGSATEADYHVLLARDLGLLDRGAYEALAQPLGEIQRMLASLIRRIRSERQLHGERPVARS
jgi:four helix bundle protein